MKALRNIFVVLTCLVLVGLVKRPFDQRLEASMLERGLLPEPLELDTREKLGQTSVAIALGGLRTVIASMMNIGAHVHWENQEWFELEQDYKTIVTLQPKTRYYWTAAGWHLYSNAYADYEDKPGVPEGRRKRKQREFFDKGIAFLDGGIEANPKDWRIWAEKGNALSQWWRPRDLDRATEAYRKAFELSGNLQIQRNRVYTLSRITGRELEAWNAAQDMWAERRNRQFPSPRTIFYALQHWAVENDHAPEQVHGIQEIFGSRLVAARDLPNHWFRQKEGYPMFGVAPLMEELCEEFAIPDEMRPLHYEPDRTFSFHPLSGKPFRVDPATERRFERAWSSIWLSDIYPYHSRLLKLIGHLSQLEAAPGESLTPAELRERRLFAARDLPNYWFIKKAWFPRERAYPALVELCEEFQVPEAIHPLRFDPDRRFSEHPLTGKPFETDPKTGKPGEKTWREIWKEDLRPYYNDFLRQYLNPNP